MKLRKLFTTLFFIIGTIPCYASDTDLEMAKLDYKFLFAKMSKKEAINSPLCKRYNEVVEALKVDKAVDCALSRGTLGERIISVEDVERELNELNELLSSDD